MSAVKMAPIVVKFEDKYSAATVAKPTAVEKKLRRSGKPLTLAELKKKKNEALQQQSAGKGKEGTSAEELKEDIDLQRLLNESHILKNLADERRNTASGAELTLRTLDDPVIGKARVRTLDARMEQLSSINGNKKKLTQLEKMPMKIRQGMIKAQKARILKHEQEAKESGIVMSINKKGQFRKIDNDKAFISKDKLIGRGHSHKGKSKDRGLKIQSVGRSTPNGLVLSANDIAKIQGPQTRRKR